MNTSAEEIQKATKTKLKTIDNKTIENVIVQAEDGIHKIEPSKINRSANQNENCHYNKT